MSRKILTSTLLILILALFALLPFTTAQEDDQPRTYYDTLNLSSPESAVMTLTEAFQREDFFTVYLVMDRGAQTAFIHNFHLLRFNHMFDDDQYETVAADIPLLANGSGYTEHIPDGIFTFDDVMLSAARHDALLIDLRGETEILNTQPYEVTDEDGETEYFVDVYAQVAGIEHNVIFRTLQAPSGKWRVRQVILPGSDEIEMIPWSVPTPHPPIVVDTATNWYTPCPEDVATLPDASLAVEGESYIEITPRCGDLSGNRQPDGTRKQGTRVQVVGTGFVPDTSVKFMLEYGDNSFTVRNDGEDVTVMPEADGSFTVEFVIPAYNGISHDNPVPVQVSIIARQEIPQE